MDRRTFLTGVAAAAVTPATASAPTIAADWMIDHTTKTIMYTGESKISVLEMHRKIQDLWNEPENIAEPNPTIRLADDRIEITGEYRFARDDSMLCDGALIERHKGAVLNADTKMRDWTEETTYYLEPVSEEEDANTIRVFYFGDERDNPIWCSTLSR